MKNFLFVIILFPIISFSQIIGEAVGVEFKFNPENIPCITEQVKEKIALEVDVNISKLQQQGKISIKKSSLAAPTFIWPVQKSATNEYNDVWAISNYVDHDGMAGLLDYTGSSRTYDGHRGTDIYTWPFSRYQQENDLAEVAAAAAGTIVLKHDGELDKNCVNNNSLQWNAVYVEHSDGSRAWYGHLKTGSLTSKNVGDAVVAGEYLGVVGSSGNSSGPHLHFEVYDSNGVLVDPFSGSQNDITSWWQNQPDYYEPQINAVLTHSAPPVFNTCPQTETTNTADRFLPNSTVYGIAYLKDQLDNTTVYMKLTKPNGSSFQLPYSIQSTTSSGYVSWPISNLNDLGTYKIDIFYQNKKVTKIFEIVSTLAIQDEKLEKITVAPNPFESQLKISGFNFDQTDYNMSIFNQLGQKVIDNNEFSDQLDLQFLSKGMYFLNIGNKATGGSKTFKIIKK